MKLIVVASCAVLCGLLASSSPAQSSNGCRTPLDVPCFTVTVERGQWRARSLRDFGYATWRETHAVRRDGSWAGSMTWDFSLRGPLQGERTDSMFLMPEGRIVRVFHKDQTFSSRTPLIWHDRPYRRSKPGDTVCSSGILHNGTDFHLAGTDTVAGIPVVKWSRNYAKLKEDIYLAPSLDCRALKGVQLHLNDWHIPVFRNWMEATAVKLGEPDPAWFMVPGGYREIEDPSLPGLKRFVEKHGPRASSALESGRR